MRAFAAVPLMVALATPASALTPPPAPVEAKVTVYFDADSTTVGIEGDDQLRRIANAFQIERGTVFVRGHTDASRAAALAQALSERMAASVRDHLVSLGVPTPAIRLSAYGATRPAVASAASGREALNRRVEVLYCVRGCPAE